MKKKMFEWPFPTYPNVYSRRVWTVIVFMSRALLHLAHLRTIRLVRDEVCV